MIHILVVEDEQRVAELLKRGLEECGYTVTLAFDGEMGSRLIRSTRFDLVISDVILPKLNGFELSKLIRQTYPDMPILMLTALGTTDDKLDGFDAGADDYMVKPFDFRELNARIRVLLKRKGTGTLQEETPTTLTYADLSMNTSTKSVYRNNVEIKLTPKEFNLLEYMMQNPERVLSRMEIAEKVWNTHFDTGTNFIDVYINYLRKKVDKDFEVKLIQTKPGMGFMLMTEA
ncbi:MAG: response regulator transcription factor [Tannerellaceae bacterium]|nr:response regulator transcription factor [Tannerellaceae bacterium]